MKFISKTSVIETHEFLIQKTGGESGILNEKQLDAALAMPMATFADEFLHKDIFEMAAAYLFHIYQAHAFVDGNKRIAFAICRHFLLLNGYKLRMSQEGVEKLVLDIASSRLKDKAEIAGILKAGCIKIANPH